MDAGCREGKSGEERAGAELLINNEQ